jgi:hypothetical protein
MTSVDRFGHGRSGVAVPVLATPKNLQKRQLIGWISVPDERAVKS